ncbi:MAG: hypothetical protein AMXMBFR82_04290 [Candidatus Hydrogenedentota bacterium]
MSADTRSIASLWEARVRRVGGIAARFLAGVIFCQRAILSLAVVGWTYRFMQGSAARYWYRATGGPLKCGSFSEFAQSDSATKCLATTPRFVFAENGDELPASFGRVRRAARTLTGSLVKNLKIGLLGFANTSVLVAPAEVLWYFGWFAGWHISFNKVYEQHAIGLTISWIGIAWFIAAMFYVPLAQARQAVTGDWKRFYDFRLIRTLVARHRLACLMLAAFYAVGSLPLLIFKFAPYSLGGMSAAMETMPNAALLARLNQYFFLTTFVAFPIYVGMRLLATRIYARALLQAVADGAVEIDSLETFERDVLRRLGVTQPAARAMPEPIVRRVPRKAWRAGLVTATIVLWFAVVAQVYVSEFFVYRGARGWLNQPLVQLPWFRYVPAHLENPDGAL